MQIIESVRPLSNEVCIELTISAGARDPPPAAELRRGSHPVPYVSVAKLVADVGY